MALGIGGNGALVNTSNTVVTYPGLVTLAGNAIIASTGDIISY